jgi:hypothetical protein
MAVEIQLFEVARADPMEEVRLAKRMLKFFQHDGASVLYSRLVTHHLSLTFPERWIGRSGHFQCHQGLKTLLL